MARVFSAILLVLLASSMAIYAYIPDIHSKRPILYWVTNPYPERHEQVSGFYEWLKAHGYANVDGDPSLELRIDSGNDDIFKLIIQGISGDCGDIVEQGGLGMQFLEQAGILADVTDAAKRLGFDPGHTYPTLAPEMFYKGRQYCFPRQVVGFVYLVNEGTFRKLGLPTPPMRWNFEEFEEMGKRFVAAANPPGKPRTAFFANEVRATYVWRSLGMSIFNETMTRCTLDDPRYARTLKLLHKWTYEDHLLPSSADLQSVATKSATQFGDSRIQMFADGRYAMVWMGRHGLPLIRTHGRLDMSVAEAPNGGFPNTGVEGTEVAIYAGSKHVELAELFLAYVASEDFSDAISVNADAVPPNPATVKTAAYLRPPAYPNEWGLHEKFVQAINDNGIGMELSRYVLSQDAYVEEEYVRQAYMTGLYTAEEAGKTAADFINAEIRRNLSQDPALQRQYEKDLATQAKIDQYRADGKAVPIDWVSNPFYQAYYRKMGLADTSQHDKS